MTQQPDPSQPYFPPGPGSGPPQGYGPPPGYGPPGYGPPPGPPPGYFQPTGPRPPKKRRSGCLAVLGVVILIAIVGGIASAVGGSKNASNGSAGADTICPNGVHVTGSTCPATDQVSQSVSPSQTSQTSTAPQYTASQQQAIQSAEGYLSDGQGFSKVGLIGQLDSSAGDGFSYADALFAVNHVTVSWFQQAAISAKGYMHDGQGFSCSGLLQQLTSSAGEQFTHAQAEYGTKSVGLGSC